MDCRSCQPSLLDLAEGQLATDAAVEARAHLRECTSCRSAYDKLVAGLGFARQLETVAAPDAVRTQLMRLAEAAALRVRTQNAPKPAPPRGPLRMVLDFMSGFAMARQVGMATIFLLIVAVGLWSLPQLRHHPATAGTSVINPAPSDLQPEGVSSDELRVASQDRATDQETAERAAPLMAAPSAASPASAPREYHVASRAKHRELGGAPESSPGADKGQRQQGLARSKSEFALEKKDSLPRLMDEAQPKAEQQDVLAESQPASPRAFPAGRAHESRPAADAPVAQAAPPAKVARRSSEAPQAVDDLMMSPYRDGAGPAQGALASGSGSGPTSGVTQAVQAQGTGTLRGQEAAASPGAGSAMQQNRVGSLAAQRKLAAERGCAAALPGYEQLVRTAPQSADAGEALIDMANCQRARGANEAARALLQRALAIAPVAARARALLVELNQPRPAAAPQAAPAEGYRP